MIFNIIYHSHTRGINCVCGFRIWSNDDSFPLTWNELRAGAQLLANYRIIPTHMGWIYLHLRQFCLIPAHSHIRGINSSETTTTQCNNDSLPHAWDKPESNEKKCETVRIIPTHVGWTHLPVQKDNLASSHSHTRGTDCINGIWIGRWLWIIPHTLDNDFSGRSQYIFNESFPRAWDKRIRVNAIEMDDRFIPTCVGQTLGSLSRSLLFPIHSHVRGTNDSRSSNTPYKTDSFPRAWDKLYI